MTDNTIKALSLQSANFTLHRTHQRRHTSYVSFGDLEACHRKIELLHDQHDACTFVTTTRSCSDIVNLFDYLKFMVCKLKIQSNLMGYIEMVLFMLLLLLIFTVFLYLISSHFILPNVIHVSHYVRVSLYDYGMSTIAVILAAPDVLWVMQECHKYSQNGTLLMSLMLGKSFTTYTVGLAVICLRGQTHVPGLEFVVHTFIAMLVLVFSVVVINYKLANDNTPVKEQTPVNIRAIAFVMTVIYVAYTAYQILTKRRGERQPSKTQLPRAHNLETAQKRNGWLQLLHALNAFEHMHISKWAIALLSPFWVLAALQIPVIDKNRPMSGWCKYLTCLNLIIFPWQAYYVKNIRSVHFFAAVYFVAIVVFIVTLIFTKVNEPPKHQGFYSIAGIIFGLSTYHIIGEEVETILWQVCSYVFDLPRDIVMLTGFVVNYLLNVVIFGNELVRLGYGNLACGVVVGIVLNQAFLILPIVVFQYCYDIQSFVAVSANTLTCFVFMLIVMVTTIIALSITNFKLRLSHGIYLFILFGLFLLYLTLTYANFIHPYGGFHSVAVELKKETSTWA